MCVLERLMGPSGAVHAVVRGLDIGAAGGLCGLLGVMFWCLARDDFLATSGFLRSTFSGAATLRYMRR